MAFLLYQIYNMQPAVINVYLRNEGRVNAAIALSLHLEIFNYEFDSYLVDCPLFWRCQTRYQNGGPL